MKRQNLRKPNAFWSNGFKSAAEIEKTGTNSNILNDTSYFRTSDLDRLSKSGLTLTRPSGLPPHTPVVQKIADKRWLIANSAKNRYLLKGVSEVQFKKSRLLHLGNVETPPHSQLSAQRACESYSYC